MPHILIVDDNPTIVELTKYTVNLREGFQVSCAYDGIEGFEMARRLTPDLIILDDKMPRLGGSQLIQILRTEGNNIPILMLTTLLPHEVGREEEREIQCLKIGCDDFMYKPYRPLLLLARIEALLRRKRDMFQLDAHTELLNYADLQIDPSAHTAHRGTRRLQLTLREYTLLSLFLRHPRQVLERDLILNHVWGYDYEGGSNVVDVYVGYLRTKTEKDGETRLIQTVRGVGYVLRELDERK